MFARQLLPPVLRGAVLLALLRVLIVPLRHLASRFTALRGQTAARLSASACVMDMERALCDAFFLARGEIYIVTPEQRETPVVRYRSEGLATFRVPDRSGGGGGLPAAGEAAADAAFVVRVPTSLCTDPDPALDRFGGRYLAAIRTIINRYKPAGRTYRIELYTHG